jgi:hypothetical protein
MSVIRPEGTPISSDRRFALSFRATISRFNKRPGCTTGAMAFNLDGSRRLCEEPTGRANARPMTSSATKQSILSLRGKMDYIAFARNDVSHLNSRLTIDLPYPSASSA